MGPESNYCLSAISQCPLTTDTTESRTKVGARGHAVEGETHVHREYPRRPLASA
jgi:hypothetical protein